ncbi:transglutaminase-like domain-containing protein [Inquilinus limosus]|uniref:SirB1 family protein n=1 Tax=Inquilinus limosus TaxID=171674 RepID=UPI003F18FC3E
MDPTIQSILDRAGAQPDDAIDLAEAALALAALDRPRGVGFDWYRRHLDQLVADVTREAERLPPAEAMTAVLARRWGYAGDVDSYDDLQNANLMRVIDRRKGLPVTLGILYLHVARAQGWTMVGLNFPSHFLVRLDAGGARTILDPFHAGMSRGPGELRDLLKAVLDAGAELVPEHYEPVSDRDILLRLQNNLKVRHIRAGDFAKALAVIEAMRRFAPNHAPLLREAGILYARLGNMRAAIDALDRYVAAPGEPEIQRHEAAILLQSFRSSLN